MNKSVTQSLEGPVLMGRCHCGVVQFEFDAPQGLQDLRRCDCSLCRRRGAIMAAVPIGAFRLCRGAADLSLYQWNHRIARHYFCRHCGIYTHHQRRSNPLEIGINLGCIEDLSPEAYRGEGVPVGNGRAMSLLAD